MLLSQQDLARRKTMMRSTAAIVAFVAVSALAMAQADTTRRPDSTQASARQDTTRRIQAESRGEVDTRVGRGFDLDIPNYGLTKEQAAELQQALARAGCDVGTPDGVVGQRTLRGLICFRSQKPLTLAEVDSLLFALNVSFAKPPAPAAPPPAATRESVLPEVIRPDTTYYRPETRARRDSASAGRDTTAPRDSTARPDTTRRPQR